MGLIVIHLMGYISWKFNIASENDQKNSCFLIFTTDLPFNMVIFPQNSTVYQRVRQDKNMDELGELLKCGFPRALPR